jgi:2-keto-4-pentenoate hydratase/2-oxohepta-3-ene-1,7-dioic acid hydratase in catechol pathway
MRVGAVAGKTVVLPALAGRWPFAQESLLSVIERGPEGLSVLRELVEGAPPDARLPLEAVEILAPIPRPRRNIMCLGWNYLDHARESARAFQRDMTPPSDPVVFTKAVTTVSALSRGMRLEPGDVIATGTPSGVGFARNPPEFLTPGDVVECEVEHIGRLRNRVSQAQE